MAEQPYFIKEIETLVEDIKNASPREERRRINELEINAPRTQDVLNDIVTISAIQKRFKVLGYTTQEKADTLSQEQLANQIYIPLLKQELEKRQQAYPFAVIVKGGPKNPHPKTQLKFYQDPKNNPLNEHVPFVFANLNNCPSDVSSYIKDPEPTDLFIITNTRTGIVDTPTGNNFDLHNAIIIGDYRCNKYKPTSANDNIQRIIPLVVTETFDCSNWDPDLFFQIEKFPCTNTIDCTNTFGYYDDFATLIDKLPDTLETLIVSSSFFAPKNIQAMLKEDNKDDIMAFFKRYPNVKVITTRTGRRDKGEKIDLKTAIQNEIDQQNTSKNNSGPSNPVPTSSGTTSVVQRPEPDNFESLDKIMADLREQNPNMEFSVLTDDEIQQAALGLKDKFIKKDANGRVVGIRKDRITPFENQIIRAVTDKTNDGGDQQITQNPDNTKGDNSATATDASAPKQRTVWLTKSVIDKLQEYHGLPLKKRIKSLNALQNPETKYKIQNVDGITDGKATELTPQSRIHGGIRLYVASFDPEQIIVLRFDSKNSQDSDLNFVKESASLFTTINNELKDELKKYKQTPSQITLYGETLYNYDSDLVRSQLKLPTKNSANTQNEDETETQDTETNTNETSIILPDKNTVDSIDATPSSDKFMTPSYSGQSDEKTDTKTQSQPGTEQPGTPQKRKYVKRQDVKYTLRQLVDLIYAAAPISLSGPDFKKSVEFAIVQFGESGEYVIPVMVKSSLLYTVPDMPRLTALVIHQAQHWRTPDDAAKLYYETHPKPNNAIAVAELSMAIQRRCQEIINDKNLEDVSIAYFRGYNDTFFLKTDELDDFVKNIVQWTPITELTTPKTSLVESTGSDTFQQEEEEEEEEEEEKKETKDILDVQPKPITQTLIDWASYFTYKGTAQHGALEASSADHDWSEVYENRGVHVNFMFLVFETLLHRFKMGDRSYADAIGYKKGNDNLHPDFAEYTITDVEALGDFVRQWAQRLVSARYVAQKYHILMRVLIGKCNRLDENNKYFYRVTDDFTGYYFVAANLDEFIDTYINTQENVGFIDTEEPVQTQPSQTEEPGDELVTLQRAAEELGLPNVRVIYNTRHNHPDGWDENWFVGKGPARKLKRKHLGSLRQYLENAKGQPISRKTQEPINPEEPTERKTLLDVKADEAVLKAWINLLEEQYDASEIRASTTEKQFKDSSARVETTQQQLDDTTSKLVEIQDQIRQCLNDGRFDFEALRIQGDQLTKTKEELTQQLDIDKAQLAQDKQENNNAIKDRDAKKQKLEKARELLAKRKEINDSLQQLITGGTDITD